MEFVRSEIYGIRKSLDAFKSEERHKDDELKMGIDTTKKELQSESRDDRRYMEVIKKELKDEMHYYWGKAEKVLEARRQDVYMIHKKIDKVKDKLLKRIDKECSQQK